MKLLSVLAILLLCGAISLAQESSDPNNSSAAKNESYIQGCLLARSNAFALKANAGKIYRLAGTNSQLGAFVGKEVRIGGTDESATDASTGLGPNTGETTTNPTAGAAPVFLVKFVTKISDQCKR